MKITIDEVEYVAKLARLKLSDEEKGLFTQQLDSILLYMDKLNELDTTNVPPTSHVLPLENVMREDEMQPSYPTEKVLAAAPERDNDFFAVPRVIE
ncbi:MAG: Asp-tRNA(Asn)/Glu-tRNA(Gln) amidotransferase subunit GatC [bacterium]